MNSYLLCLLGGALIGASALLLLLGKGQISGISVIVGGLVTASGVGVAWRVLFLSFFCSPAAGLP